MIRLKIRALTSKMLGVEIASMQHSDWTYTIDLVRRFPECKWSATMSCWKVPATMENVAYLRQTFRDDEYETNADAKVLLSYHALTALTASQREKRRWRYVFGGEIPEYEWVLDRGPRLKPGEPCRQCGPLVEVGAHCKMCKGPHDASRGAHRFGEGPHDDANGKHRTRDPFAHQIVAADACSDLEFFALLMEQGTGKTAVNIQEIAAEALKRKAMRAGMNEADITRDVRPVRVLVVCPATLCPNWVEEIESWMPKHYPDDPERCVGDLKLWTCRLRSNPADVATDLFTGMSCDADVRVWVTNYERVKSNLETLKLMEFDFIIADEATAMKNPSAKRSKAMVELSPSAAKRRMDTGTILANNIFDVHPPFEFLQPGCLGYTSHYAFRHAYGQFSANKGGWDNLIGYRNLDQLKERMARFSFQVKREDCLDLPEKMYKTIPVEMGEKQRALYEQMSELFVAHLVDDPVLWDSTNTVRASILIARLLRFAQITSGFINTSEGAKRIVDGDGKLQALKDIVENASGKVLVWARFHEDIRAIRAMLDEAGIRNVEISGRVGTEERKRAIKQFGEGRGRLTPEADDDVRVLVGEPGSGGVGLTLLGTVTAPCHTVVYYSQDYSLHKRQQSEDRIHRIGQSHPCMYYTLVSEGTIDEKIEEALRNKRKLSDVLKDVSSIREALLGTPTQRRVERTRSPAKIRAILKEQGITIPVEPGSTEDCKDFEHDEAHPRCPHCSGDPAMIDDAALVKWWRAGAEASDEEAA